MEPSAKPAAGAAGESVAATYDAFYRQPNYFHYREWLYRPFIRSLVRLAGLRPGARVLDAGCGQGFFTALLAETGLAATGADLSTEGVAQARARYGPSGAAFEVGDALRLPYGPEFDCVYTRSCSLYNRPDFAGAREVTDALMNYLRPGGVLIFDYYTNLCARKQAGSSWRYHSLAEARRHFAPYPRTRIYFSSRLDTLLLGRHGFGLTGASALFSRLSGTGGELLALVQKS